MLCSYLRAIKLPFLCFICIFVLILFPWDICRSRFLYCDRINISIAEISAVKLDCNLIPAAFQREPRICYYPPYFPVFFFHNRKFLCSVIYPVQIHMHPCRILRAVAISEQKAVLPLFFYICNDRYPVAFLSERLYISVSVISSMLCSYFRTMKLPVLCFINHCFCCLG